MKILISIIGLIAIIALVLGIVAVSSDKINFGSTHFTGPIYSEEGYVVDAITVIDGSGNVDGVITSSVGTFSSTLGVTGVTTLSGTVSAATTTIVGPLVYGGNVYTITTPTTTITAAQLCDNAVIKFRLTDTDDTDRYGAFTYTTLFIATSSELIADCIPEPGDTRKVLFQNYSTSTMGILIGYPDMNEGGGGANEHGIDLLEASADGDVVINQTEYAWIEMTNIDDSTTTVSVVNLQVAD